MSIPLPIMKTIALDKTAAGGGSFSPVGTENPYLIPPKGITQVVLSWAAGHDITIIWGPNGATTTGSYSIKTITGQTGMQTAIVEIVKKTDVGAFWVTTPNLPAVDIGKPVGLRMTTWPLDE